jgi:mannan endo-1,4-beta-mannosidase
MKLKRLLFGIGLLSILNQNLSAQINANLVNPSPSAEAKGLYQFLKDNYGSKIISGCSEQADADWLKTNTGKSPVLVGNDFLFCGRGYTWYNEQTPIDQAVNTYNRNGIPTICWHWRDPSRKTEEFYWQGANANYTTFDVKQILTTGSTGYNQMLSDIDYTAGLLKKIRDKGVPVLWRPLHEAAGGWFWWGRDGASCKKLWQIMYDRLVNYHGLKNLIWVWTKEANDDAFYPGDSYVDLVGRDYYSTGDHSSRISEYNSISSKYANKKITTISECGSFPDPDNLTKDAAKWSWYMVWGGDFVRSATYNSLDLWKKAFGHNYVLTLDEMPNLKTYGQATTTGAVSNGTYQMTFRHSGKSLNVSGSSTADGGDVVQWPYGGGNNEKWFVKDEGSGQYSIKNVNSGRGLDVVGASTADGADINQWYYAGANNAKWKIEAVSGQSGYYRIKNVNSGKCIEVANSGTTDGLPIQQWTCYDYTNQVFSLNKINSNTARMAAEIVSEEAPAEITVGPNPSKTDFILNSPGAFKFAVYDRKGLVHESGQGENSVSFGKNLASGFYVL